MSAPKLVMSAAIALTIKTTTPLSLLSKSDYNIKEHLRQDKYKRSLTIHKFNTKRILFISQQLLQFSHILMTPLINHIFSHRR